MKIAFNIYVVLTLMVIAQGLFAALILSTSKVNKLANRFLSLLLLSFSLWLIDSFYKVAEVYQQDPEFYFQPIFYSFAFGPLIFFYVKSITNSSFQFSKKDWVHFFPVLLQTGLYWFLTFQPYSYKLWFWETIHFPITYGLEFNLTLISMAIYLGFSIRLLVRYQKWLEDQFSEFSKIHLNWLKIVLMIMLVLCVFWSVDLIARYLFDIYLTYNFSEISLGFVVLLLAYGGIRQSNNSQVNFENKVVETNLALDEIDVELVEKIKQRMLNEKDYLNPTLSLKEFAKNLNTPARTISKHINQGLGISFVDFVNQYRVEEVKHKITSGELDQFTLLSIALESGFNSKSSFNRIFKKLTQMSPTEYVNESQSKN
ncbi:MAG: helix-turn-helix domain-containing protein [Saprospiraceae bacterium]